jgi:glycosyl transferase family 87
LQSTFLPVAAEKPARADPTRKALTHALAFWGVAAPVWVLVAAALDHQFAVDFNREYMPAAHALLRGVSPYTGLHSAAALAHEQFLLPPLTGYLLAPFTQLSPVAAQAVAVVLVAAAVPATLLVLSVRDWRCHAIAFVWWPVIIGVQSANVTLPLMLGLAVVWRYRDRALVAAAASALVIAVKPFLWPILIWLVATRRYRAAAIAAVTSAALIVLPWAGIGFSGMRTYPHLLIHISRVEGEHSYSMAALFLPVLPSWTVATAVGAAAGLGVLVFALLAGRRGRDRDAFAAAVVGLLILSPLLELHYFALLLIVVALYRRRLSLAWAAPILLVVAPSSTFATSRVEVVRVLVVAAITLGLAVTDWTPRALERSLWPEPV